MATVMQEEPGHDIGSLVSRVLSQTEKYEEPISMAARQAKAWSRVIEAVPSLGDRRAFAQTDLDGTISPGGLFNDAAANIAAEGMANWMGAGSGVSSPLPGLRRSSYEPSEGSRYLIVPGAASGNVVLILDPQVDYSDSREITGEIDLDEPALIDVMGELRSDARHRSGFGMTPAGRLILQGLNPATTAGLVRDLRPEVVVTHLPKMVPLCVSRPHLRIECGEQNSTAGILCVDADGVLGVTAALHATGPAGTSVTVGGRAATVKATDSVQDLAFVALGPGHPLPQLCGLNGLVDDRAPSEGERVWFEGSTSGAVVETRISSHDRGIGRRRASLQLRVQTRQDASPGDSGAALVDGDDRVLAFAKENSDFGEHPEFTDWVLAANALIGLGLTPYK